ncbi:MAG: alanine--tRNA ligase [Leptospiraceae bacterium]|nr:alanine--tRNA ligase [Leptospiraceae bacterium]MDW7976791.1 alanine--tRNA ligase [Leptospiraceae bacterium]
MKKFTCKELRKAWVDFFVSKDHLHLPSSSLLPAEDPTLLFTSAGMVPFKEYFNGTKKPPHPRIATIQKCLRTTDLESVGKTARHCTFFEMLGNFSFGDYFKKEAIEWAYEFSIKVLEIDPEKIHVSVYHEDQEAYEIWNKHIGIPEHKIVRLGKEQNWWGPAGDSGPCGPCTELYFDRGEHICHTETGCGNPATCKPGNDCDRFFEYWNLVFNEYFQDTEGNLHPLPQKGIDTGAGLERIVALLNGTDSVYETDELLSLKEEIQKQIETILKRKLDFSFQTQSALRVLTDHVRSVTFAMSDGIFPENTGRGYVIRRIIRRALLFAYQLGITEAILYKIQPKVVEIYASFYPELEEHRKKVQDVLYEEEQRFLETLNKGMKKWEEFLEEHKKEQKQVFDGEKAFILYDTFGFPVEITRELAEKEGLSLDIETFNQKMEEQKQLSKQTQQWKDFQFPHNFPLINEQTEFTGYFKYREKSKILAIIYNNQSITKLDKKDIAIIITDRTNFYPEGGGQIGDTGIIKKRQSLFRVIDTKKKGNLILHIGHVEKGKFQVGDEVDLIIDEEKRKFTTYHHSATHLLHKALRDVLGDSVFQTGSLVSDEYLRFDFSYNKRLTEQQLEEVERRVIDAILAKADVKIKHLPLEEAKKTGALAFFGEKYGEIVRIIEMGENGKYSMEFCGGCHVQNTNEIRYFHIIKESSPGAGNRRIEAVANQKALQYFYEKIQKLKKEWEDKNQKMPNQLSWNLPETMEEITEYMSSNPYSSIQLEKRIIQFEIQLQEIEKKLKKELKKEKSLEHLLEKNLQFENLNSVKLYSFIEENLTPEELRILGDKIKEKEPYALILAASVQKEKASLMFTCTKKLIELGIDCSELLSQSVKAFSGKGGGKKDLAQGGVEKNYVNEVISFAKKLAREKILK